MHDTHSLTPDTPLQIYSLTPSPMNLLLTRPTLTTKIFTPSPLNFLLMLPPPSLDPPSLYHNLHSLTPEFPTDTPPPLTRRPTLHLLHQPLPQRHTPRQL
ncbi:hypothetical protein Pcinc_010498 [Petrolisthes cinctipes]|uniref:Uncharacterized protein n=1 Tax=Petrolisthes cinctipes TaxID=88211 RepID=A0AAE1G2N5_PETCI|nr:hypothetical protein Pcinc_010498 [Petrolisthes cinctipes]